MATVMAVTFERHGQLFYLDPGEREYRVGDWVRYPTAEGVEVAQVVWIAQHQSAIDGTLPVCDGPASEADLARDAEHRQIRQDAAHLARTLIARHGLPMKVVAVDYLTDQPTADRLFAIYYTAPSRVDFRALLVDLARELKARIDLRQIGSRDAAQLLGGIGSCGRELCCTTFMSKVEPVASRLSRQPGLPVNPLQLAGVCGRLKCCLAFGPESCSKSAECPSKPEISAPGSPR